MATTIRDGGIYRLYGDDSSAEYRAALEDSESSGDIVASFQRLPVNQPDDEPVLFLDSFEVIRLSNGDAVASAADLIDTGR